MSPTCDATKNILLDHIKPNLLCIHFMPLQAGETRVQPIGDINNPLFCLDL